MPRHAGLLTRCWNASTKRSPTSAKPSLRTSIWAVIHASGMLPCAGVSPSVMMCIATGIVTKPPPLRWAAAGFWATHCSTSCINVSTS